MGAPDRIDRRRFLLRRGSVHEVSCERLCMKYIDARDEGRLAEFLASVEAELRGAAPLRVSGREWLARDDFRRDVGPLLRARGVVLALFISLLGGVAACGGA